MKSWMLIVTAGVFGLILAGCGEPASPPFPTWSEPVLTYVPQSGSSNAFDAYALAGMDAEKRGQRYLKLVSFTPQRRLDAMAAVEPAIRLIEGSLGKPCEFRHAVHGPFEPVPYRAGWRLIGLVLGWRIEKAAVNSDFESATKDALTAIKFGLDLTGGDVMDATLGLGVVDTARRQISPYLVRMDSSLLLNLSQSVSKSLASRPRIEELLENERRDMLMAVQTIQEYYRKRDWDGIEAQLGSGVKPAIEHLRQLSAKDAKVRAPYFEGFADEAQRETQWLSTIIGLPAVDRKPDKPVLAASRPWQRFSRHLFQATRGYLPIMDRSIARTQLFAIECSILASVKRSGAAPKSLSGFSEMLRTDPYTGRDFAYRAEGRDYRLYSVGPDFRDDGGQTNSEGTAPDLVLENRS